MIEVKNLFFGFNSKRVLEDINLEIREGEMVFLLGPNGSGKTTLLRCIAGILKPEGAVYIEGKSLRSISRTELAKILGYVPQRGEISFLTVFDAVLLGRKPHIGWEAKEEDYRVVEEIIRLFGLENLASRKLNELSGGELQLVLIARALAQQPKYILLDEPTNNLDIRNQVGIMKILRRIVRERNISTVITTHDLNLAVSFADRVVLIKNGRVFAQGGVEVINEKNVREVYGVNVRVIRMDGTLLIAPLL
uniref:ABC transporter ATP-binding protein n=1 Tax=Geoglobus ahangari TaxID=113653 RepID=A0A7C4W4E7_9EURY